MIENSIRSWNTREDIEMLDQVIAALRDKKVLEPGTISEEDPVDLAGLSFPTVTLGRALDLDTAVVRRVVGKQEFDNARLRKVNLAHSQLDYSVWSDCHFEEVTFDKSSLRSIKFFGCVFNKCSFKSVRLCDASFSVGRNGKETVITNSVFQNANMSGASCHRLVLNSSSFINSNLDGFVFDSPFFDGVEFVGEYLEMTIRGAPGERNRNRLRMDLSKASIVWLNADYGVDLTGTTLPADDSCFVVTDRVRAVEIFSERLPRELGDIGARAAIVIHGIYSDKSISPLERSQETLLVSQGMIADFVETEDEKTIRAVFECARSVAAEEGILASVV